LGVDLTGSDTTRLNRASVIRQYERNHDHLEKGEFEAAPKPLDHLGTIAGRGGDHEMGHLRTQRAAHGIMEREDPIRASAMKREPLDEPSTSALVRFDPIPPRFSVPAKEPGAGKTDPKLTSEAVGRGDQPLVAAVEPVEGAADDHDAAWFREATFRSGRSSPQKGSRRAP